MNCLIALPRCLAAAILVGLAACSGMQNGSPTVNSSLNSSAAATRIISDHGDAFAARYAGTYDRTADRSDTAKLFYQGSGKAKFLHKSNEEISLTWYCDEREVVGIATLTDAHHAADSVMASVSTKSFNMPCYSFTHHARPAPSPKRARANRATHHPLVRQWILAVSCSMKQADAQSRSPGNLDYA